MRALSFRAFACLTIVATTAALVGCSGSAESADEDPAPAAAGALTNGNSSTTDSVDDLKITFDSDHWRGSVAKGDGAAKPLPFCSLQGGKDYGIEAEFLFVCRDGDIEVLVDTEKNDGRIRALNGTDKAGLECTQKDIGNHHSAYECKAKGSAPAKFAGFDKADLDRSRGFLWLPSVGTKQQGALAKAAATKIGAKKLSGVMSTNAKKCTVDVDQSGDEITVTLTQVNDDGTTRKLMDFAAPQGALTGSSDGSGFVAIQSQQKSGADNYSGVKDRKMVVTTDGPDGLKVEVIASDNGGASGKYCRKLTAQ